MIADGKRRKETIELVDRDDYTKLLGYYTYSDADYRPPITIPDGWAATMAMEYEMISRFLKKQSNLDKVAYTEGGFIK